jgi:hypothetical protein
MPRVVEGVCWFPFGKVLDKYVDIVRSTDILQVIKELHALPIPLKRTKPCEDPLLTFLDEVDKHIKKHFSSMPELAQTISCADRVTAELSELRHESDSSALLRLFRQVRLYIAEYYYYLHHVYQLTQNTYKKLTIF